MEKIDTIIKALVVIMDQNELRFSGDMVLDCACRLYMTDKIQAGKNDGANLDATNKQRTAMLNMKIPFNDAITKEEAKKLISDKIASFNN